MKNFMKALLISGSIAALANMAAYAAELRSAKWARTECFLSMLIKKQIRHLGK